MVQKIGQASAAYNEVLIILPRFASALSTPKESKVPYRKHSPMPYISAKEAHKPRDKVAVDTRRHSAVKQYLEFSYQIIR